MTVRAPTGSHYQDGLIVWVFGLLFVLHSFLCLWGRTATAQSMTSQPAENRGISVTQTPNQTQTYDSEPQSRLSIPEDLESALKLAREAFGRGEPEITLAILDTIVARNDPRTPDVLVLKINFLLTLNDLAEAEATEDILVGRFPDHSASLKGARAVYDYYLQAMHPEPESVKIDWFNAYIYRHRRGPLEAEAIRQLQSFKAGIKERFERSFHEQLAIAKDYYHQNRMDQAEEAMEKADAIVKSTRDLYDIEIDTVELSRLRDQMADENAGRQAWERIKFRFDNETAENRIRILETFIRENPDNIYLKDAEARLQEERVALRVTYQRWFDEILAQAKLSLVTDRLSAAKDHLDNALELMEKGKVLGIVLNERELDDVQAGALEMEKLSKQQAGSVETDVPVKEIPPSMESPYEKKSIPVTVDSEIKPVQPVENKIDSTACVDKDGRFCKLSNALVLDISTGLLWASRDNGYDINWNDAKEYCETYREAGYTDWRMPTQNELAALYDENKTYRATLKNYDVHLTPLIQVSTCCFWASNTRPSSSALLIFRNGYRGWDVRSFAVDRRVLPVRDTR